ncbi:hypothetical protein VTJ83DRAFT_1814 [Remersonia thermophila]|uniref:DUF8032 domain-containing protein n=1 Tax=Remersonia thermophila TaxID=72144 RepID=A0ABR4DGY4_9PEZI
MQHHPQQQGPVPPHLQHSRTSNVVHQSHHSPTPGQQPPPPAQHSTAYSYPQSNQTGSSQDHGLPYYAHTSPYSTPNPSSGYTSAADTGDMMAATMPRPYPPMSYHTGQSNSPAPVPSPSAHDQQRSMYGPPSQLHQQSMYYGAPQQQYSSMPPPATQSPYAHHAQQSQQSMGSPGMMMSHTPSQHQMSQHAQPHSQQGMTVSPRPDKIETHSLTPRISPTSAPVGMGNGSSTSPQNGAPLTTPTTSGTTVNANAAPGPIPATTPLVVRQDTNGVQWIAFEYSRDRVKMEYTIRCDVESVNQDELTPEFKAENCVYPRACCPKEQYRGNRLQYETECNTVGWALAQLNPPLRGKRGLIQRAVDSWRNSNADPRLRSRRVRRMAKMNYRNQKPGSATPTGVHMTVPGGPSPTGMGTPTMGTSADPSGMGKPGLGAMPPQMHHHHGAHQDGSTQGGEVDDGTYSDPQHTHHHHQPPTHAGPDGSRPAHVFTGYGAYNGAPQSSSMHGGMSGGEPSHVGTAPMSAAGRSTPTRGGFDDVTPEDLFPDLPDVKKRKFILVEDSERNNRLRVRVTLDGVDTREIPDSFRKSSSVYPRSYFPREMQSPPPSATGSRFFTDDASDGEDDGVTETEGRAEGRGARRRANRGRTMVKVPTTEGRVGEVAIPRMRKSFRGKEVRLNDLGYRMAWLQSRVFAGRTVFLQRALDCYRNKTRSAMESVMQDVKTAAPHYETRVGKRRWNERMRLAEEKEE